METVYLALGTNLGDRAANLRRARAALRPHFIVEALSPIYETEPEIHAALLPKPLIPGALATCPPGDITCQPTLAYQMNYSNITLGLGARWRFGIARSMDLRTAIRAQFSPRTPDAVSRF